VLPSQKIVNYKIDILFSLRTLLGIELIPGE